MAERGRLLDGLSSMGEASVDSRPRAELLLVKVKRWRILVAFADRLRSISEMGEFSLFMLRWSHERIEWMNLNGEVLERATNNENGLIRVESSLKRLQYTCRSKSRQFPELCDVVKERSNGCRHDCLVCGGKGM